jgi:hypothetical protein
MGSVAFVATSVRVAGTVSRRHSFARGRLHRPDTVPSDSLRFSTVLANVVALELIRLASSSRPATVTTCRMSVAAPRHKFGDSDGQ